MAVSSLLEMQNVAVIGVNDDSNQAAYVDAKGLIDLGYQVHLVNPEFAESGCKILGQKVYASLVDIGDLVELVNLHISSNEVDYWMHDLSERMERRADIEGVWFEPGIESNESIVDANDFGWIVVQNCCILKEIRLRDNGNVIIAST
ncbi:MAG TPA: CoA-binding protein [Candidatus Poseidoniales archaeon]|nr:CoA-binding protein [Candidatus Poseidoniales archaeon]